MFVLTSLLFSLQSNAPSFGLLFDIDGVIVRGKKIIPKVPETFKRLINSEGKFRIPTVFLTNAGNGLTEEKAKRLSEWLNIKVGFRFHHFTVKPNLKWCTKYCYLKLSLYI